MKRLGKTKQLKVDQQLMSWFRPRMTKYIPHRPTPKQAAFLWLTCLDAFYGGAAGGGKSDALLMAALQYVDVSGYNALLIRNTYANLSKPEGLIPRSHEWLHNTDAHWNGDEKRWYFETGDPDLPATLSFGYLDSPLDHLNYQSAAYQFIGIDELTQIRELQALYMFSRLRKSSGESNKELAAVPLRFRAAANPPSREIYERGAWVKNRYVDPKTRGDRIFIPAKINDNPFIDSESYLQSLLQLDAVTRTQLQEGDWDIHVEGNFFKQEWFSQLIDKAPQDAIKVRGWDLAGTENPTAAYTVGVKLCYSNGIFYLEHVTRFQGTPGDVEDQVYRTAVADGAETVIDIPQDPGQAGKYQVRNYVKRLAGYNIRFSPESGSKTERAAAFSAQAEAGNVILVRGDWNEAYVAEAILFPDGEYKDQIDATSRAFHRLLAILGLTTQNYISATPRNVKIRNGGDRGAVPGIQILSEQAKQELVSGGGADNGKNGGGQCSGYAPRIVR